MISTILLQTDAILQVPLNNYTRDFTFIVNNTEFLSTKLAADLISPKILKLHQVDFTIDEYIINTKNQGNFQAVLDLLTFKSQKISESEIPFISEIIEELQTEKININIFTPEMNLNNIIELISKHEKSKFFYSSKLSSEIDFLSSHFYEMKENQLNELIQLSTETIEKVINNKNLVLKNEDQLLSFINKLYSKSRYNSNFYEYVYFTNVSSQVMAEFISLIDIDCMTYGTWNSLSKRLIEEIKTKTEEEKSCRYKKSENENDSKEKEKKKEEEKVNYIEIPYSNGQLRGIFKYLNENSNINNEVNVTYSSLANGNKETLLNIDATDNEFRTSNSSNSWICFEFKKHRIIPSNYTIKSSQYDANDYHLKSWAIEGSADGSNWIQIDQQNNCSLLNGKHFVHTFSVSKINENVKSFKFIRIRATGPSWYNNNNSDNSLQICAIEFYGKLI